MIIPDPNNRTLLIDLGILFIVALAVRLIGVGITHLPVGDEMFHVLAAQSWSVDGTLSIADGIYERAPLFTKMIGTFFHFTGVSFVVARIPVLIFGIVWVLVLFIWVQFNAGRLAAWISAGLFCLAPHGIELSLYCRFYTLHGTMFLLGTISFYTVLTQNHGWLTKTILAVVSLLCFSLAIHLHPITLIGLIALGTAVVVDFLVQHYKLITNKKNRLWIALALMTIVTICVILLYLNLDRVNTLIQTFIKPAYANLGADLRYYHKHFISGYPVLWPLLPMLFIIAVYHKPRMTLFCASLFIAAFILHSLAGRKAERYIYYSLPFLFTVWGIALAIVIPYLNRLLSETICRLDNNYFKIKDSNLVINIFKWSSISAVILFLLGSSGAFLRTVSILRGESNYFGLNLPNWNMAKTVLQPLVDNAPIVVTTNFPKTLYYFGRYDLSFSKVVVYDIVGDVEFGSDPRTGRQVISTVKSLQLVFDQNPHGIFIGQESEWRNRFRLTNEGADFLENNAVRIDLPPESLLFAFKW